MNTLIKEQLSKCEVAVIPPFDDDTAHIVVQKQDKVEITSYSLQKCYLIELSDSILQPSEDVSFHINWNKGSLPRSKFYNAQVIQLVGSVVKITGIGIDGKSSIPTGDMWEGWLPKKDIKVVKELT